MATVTDPDCGMTFDCSQTATQTIHEGTSYLFCSDECRRTFEENPGEFIQQGGDHGGIRADGADASD